MAPLRRWKYGPRYLCADAFICMCENESATHSHTRARTTTPLDPHRLGVHIVFIASWFYFSQFSHTFRPLFLFPTSFVPVFRIAQAALASEAVGGLLDLKSKS